jgi:hypothetical protein
MQAVAANLKQDGGYKLVWPFVSIIIKSNFPFKLFFGLIWG